MEARDGALWAVLPERLDRPLRLGPFASGQDLVKFVVAAATGSIVGLTISPPAGVAIAGVGAIVALWRPDGEALDRRAAVVARWLVRRRHRSGAMSASRGGPDRGTRTADVVDGRRIAVVRVGGVPLTFLPPSELEHQFDLYRSLLRAAELPLMFHVTRVPIFPGVVTPAAPAATEVERGPRAGYAELVGLIARRRAVRRVHVVVSAVDRSAAGDARLETATAGLLERLRELGAPAERLRGRALREAAARAGWRLQEVAA